MYELKPLTQDAIPGALDKAVRYRLLNEPMEAESICLDILEVEPDNQKALINLLLALTDQFRERLADATSEAREVLARMSNAYHRAYYEGIVWERRARAQQRTGSPGYGPVVHEGLVRALECYEKAIELRPKGSYEAILRWNTCVRVMNRHPEIKPEPAESFHPLLE